MIKPRTNRYEGRGHDGRKFIMYALTKVSALRKLKPHGVKRVRRLLSADREAQKKIIDNRRAPGS